MNNHIARHGLLVKKNADGRRYLYAFREWPRARDQYDFAITKIHGDTEPEVLSCGFDRSPYVPRRNEVEASEYTGFEVWTTVAALRTGAEHCSFCETVWCGLQEFGDKWQKTYGLMMYSDHLHRLNLSEEEYYSEAYDMEKRAGFLQTVSTDHSSIILQLKFISESHPLVARLLLEAYTDSSHARMRGLVALEFHSLQGDANEWLAFGAASQVCSNLLGKDSISKLRRWTEDCRAHHSSCKIVIDPVEPARLLCAEKNADPKVPIVYLRQTIDLQGPVPFVALSHCWAKTNPLKTTTENYSHHLKDVSWDALPLAFRDTILLSLDIGIHYIWIDSLCILQDDEDDWLSESPKMGAIYGSAEIVFAAHGSDLSLKKEIVCCSTESASKQQEILRGGPVYVRPKIDHSDLVNPVEDPTSYFGRAWCFQERIFAARVLHFGNAREEVVFECNESLQCECDGVRNLVREQDFSSAWTSPKKGLAEALTVARSMPAAQTNKNLWRLYSSLCETFTSQVLTRSDDALIALSSLAQCLSPYLGKYYAGLFEHKLLIDLQWESLDGRKSRRHGKYCAPSFSWASRTGPVVWYISENYLSLDPEQCDFAEILEIACDTAPGSPFGRVSGGFIKLRGCTTTMQFEDIPGCYEPGRLKVVPPGKNDDIEYRSSLGNFSDNPDEAAAVCMDVIDDMLEARGKTVTCLDIMRDKNSHSGFISALVLLPVEDGRTYRRIGFSTMARVFFEDAELEDVIIT